MDLILPALRLWRHRGISQISAPVVIFLRERGDDEQNYRTSLEIGHQFTTSSPTRPRVGSGDQGIPCANGQLPLAACPRTPYALGDLAIDCTHHNASLAGEPATLTATEQKFLFELSANAGRALTHPQRLQRLWGSNHSSPVPLVPTAVRTPLIPAITLTEGRQEYLTTTP